MKYYTKGLGDGSYPDNLYEFNIENNVLTIPSRVVSRDEMAPDFPEQENWINSLRTQLNLTSVYYETWEFDNDEDISKFVELLQQVIVEVK